MTQVPLPAVCDLPVSVGPQAVWQLLWYLMQVSVRPVYWVAQ